jgi:hypothetical protein
MGVLKRSDKGKRKAIDRDFREEEVAVLQEELARARVRAEAHRRIVVELESMLREVENRSE